MKYLQTYKLFESSNKPELSDQEIENDRLYTYIHDICQEAKDDGFTTHVSMSECAKVDNMFCDDVIAVVIHKPTNSFLDGKTLKYSEIKDVFDRLVDFLTPMGYISIIKRFEWMDKLAWFDFDGDPDIEAETFKIIFYKSIDHIIESKKEVSKLKFNKQPRKKGAKTDVYNVIKGGNTIGQVKWSSRLRGYGFLPTSDCESEIKEFVKELMRVRREEKKKK